MPSVVRGLRDTLCSISSSAFLIPEQGRKYNIGGEYMAFCFPRTEAPDRYCRYREETGEQSGERLGEAAERISTALLTLTRQGGTGNFMLVGAGDDYVQFLGRRGDPEIECELACPAMEDGCDPRPGKLAWLAKSGFTWGEDYLTCKYRIGGERSAWEVAQCTVLLLRSLYGFTPETRVQIKLVLE